MCRSLSVEEAVRLRLTGPFNVGGVQLAKFVVDGERVHLFTRELQPKGRKGCKKQHRRYDGGKLSWLQKHCLPQRVIKEFDEAEDSVRNLPKLDGLQTLFALHARTSAMVKEKNK